jgi:hypothetical protein
MQLRVLIVLEGELYVVTPADLEWLRKYRELEDMLGLG